MIQWTVHLNESFQRKVRTLEGIHRRRLLWTRLPQLRQVEGVEGGPCIHHEGLSIEDAATAPLLTLAVMLGYCALLISQVVRCTAADADCASLACWQRNVDDRRVLNRTFSVYNKQCCSRHRSSQR